VLVTVSGIRGSAPRETGAHMIVTATETIDSIGGGQLEYQCTARAADMLTADAPQSDRQRFSLGANCGQCCGGVVEILFDYLPGSRAQWLDSLRAAFRSQEFDRMTLVNFVVGEKHTEPRWTNELLAEVRPLVRKERWERQRSRPEAFAERSLPGEQVVMIVTPVRALTYHRPRIGVSSRAGMGAVIASPPDE